MYGGPVPINGLRAVHQTLAGFRWYISFIHGDLWAISWSAISIGENVTNAECCDLTTRSPAECFLDYQVQDIFTKNKSKAIQSYLNRTMSAPKANFMLSRHFESNVCSLDKRWSQAAWSADLKRGSNQHVCQDALKGTDRITLHGRYRGDVLRHRDPTFSKIISVPEICHLCSSAMIEKGNIDRSPLEKVLRGLMLQTGAGSGCYR